jgi:multiple sugar transport system substrate-binding protein
MPALRRLAPLRAPRRAAAVLALAALALAACGPPQPDGEVVLEFWAMGSEGERVAELMPAFERENPGIRVRVQQIPWTAAHEKLLTAYAGRATPDLCQLGNTWVAELAALNALAPLDARVAASAAVDSADYFPGIWDTNVIGGTLRAVPWYVDTRLLFYRRDILARAGYDAVPHTWDGWLSAMRAVKQQVGENRYAVLLPINEFEPLLILALQSTPSLLRDGDRYGNFRSAEFREAFSFYIRLFREGLAPPATNNQIANVWQEFGNGLFTFYITGPWNISEFQNRLPDSLEGAWATAPMPGPDGPGASTAGGSSLAVFEASPHQDEAWKLIEYLSRPSVQARFYEMLGDLPARESAWEAPALAGNPYAAAFRDQLGRARATPKVPEQERIVQKLREVAEFVVMGRMTEDEAVALLDREVDAILDKRRYLLDRAARADA